MKQGKSWGTTTAIWKSETAEAHALDIVAGGFCSEHFHAKKRNIFHVIDGVLEIWQWPRGSDEPDVTMICGGGSTTIEPGVWHRFTAVTPVKCIEIYDVKIEDDIVRRSVGGKDGA